MIFYIRRIFFLHQENKKKLIFYVKKIVFYVKKLFFYIKKLFFTLRNYFFLHKKIKKDLFFTYENNFLENKKKNDFYIKKIKKVYFLH